MHVALQTLHVFFFNDTATTEIYTLSLHDALPICPNDLHEVGTLVEVLRFVSTEESRSEEHTSELQSRQYLVCRLLLEKKKKKHSLHEKLPTAHLRNEIKSAYSLI